MTLQALLFSSDDAAADVLGRVLPGFGLAAERFSQAEAAIARLQEQKFEAILLDLSETGMDVLTAETQFPGAVLGFSFQLADGSLHAAGLGQVAWANPNGQTGVHFVDISEEVVVQLKAWVKAASSVAGTGPGETVPHCKLTDLSLGGCYVETDAPFPERALVDLCLTTGDM